MDTRKDTSPLVPVESSTRPGLVHRVDLDACTCSCEATVPMCRHQRIALIRRRKQLYRLEETYRQQLLDDEERQELLDVIRRLRRTFYR